MKKTSFIKFQTFNKVLLYKSTKKSICQCVTYGTCKKSVSEISCEIKKVCFSNFDFKSSVFMVPCSRFLKITVLSDHKIA